MRGSIAALAAPPLWWGTGNPPVIVQGVPPNNYGPANIGQAKHMAKSALDALETVDSDLAGLIEADLVGPGRPIPHWNPPVNQAERDKNHAPLLIGQLKAIADPFYTRLHAAAPAWLEAERIENQTNHPDSIFPWTSAISDDNNKGVTNIGQLKAVFSLRFEALATFDSDGDGMPDWWEIENGFDPNDPTDASLDSSGDGITNLQAFQLNLDPNSFNRIGPVNLDFNEEILDSGDLSFRNPNPPSPPKAYDLKGPYYPSDLYDETSVAGWQAVEGQHIEIWDETKEPPGEGHPTPYVELQSHWDAKGIKQQFDMLPGTTETFLLGYKGRYEGSNDSNPFTLKVEGAHEVLVDGEPAEEEGEVKQKSFMTDDDNVAKTYAEWKYASVTITADPEATTLVPVILTLIPDDTDPSITHGGFVDLLPVEITVVFGEGPGGLTQEGGITSKQNFENFLETVKVTKSGNTWVVKGENNRLFGIETGTDEATLLRALSTPGQTVIFDGHANFGLGPNFSKATNKSIDSFSNFGTGSTDIPVDYRGDGTMQDVLPYYPSSPPPELTLEEQGEILAALHNMVEEGWSYLVVDAADVKGNVANEAVPHMEGRWKYERDHAESAGDPLLKQGAGLEEYHFMTESQSRRVIISAPDDDLPTLRYKTFFYNACSTGPHFIENFDHGEFIYTNRTCAVFEATPLFVKGLIEEKTTAETLEDLETKEADGPENGNVIVYEVKNF